MVVVNVLVVLKLLVLRRSILPVLNVFIRPHITVLLRIYLCFFAFNHDPPEYNCSPSAYNHAPLAYIRAPTVYNCVPLHTTTLL